MNRRDFQQIAQVRLREVETLLKQKNYDGAYYLAGYVVECALKACIAKRTRRFDFPDKKTVLDSYTHDFNKLIACAHLETELATQKQDPTFEQNWTLVKDWSEESRYQRYTAQQAINLYEAISDTQKGVFPWLQTHW